ISISPLKHTNIQLESAHCHESPWQKSLNPEEDRRNRMAVSPIPPARIRSFPDSVIGQLTSVGRLPVNQRGKTGPDAISHDSLCAALEARGRHSNHVWLHLCVRAAPGIRHL